MDRSTWMYQIERATIEYLEQLSIFLKVAEDDRVKKGKSKIHCPCKKCLNWTCYPDLKTIKSHLIEKGFMQRYTCWDFHREVKPKSNTSVSNCDVEYNNDSNNNNRDNLNDMLPNLEGNAAEKNHDQSQQLLVDSETPLYEGCEDFTKLSAIYRLMNVKAINSWSDTGFTSLLEALHEMFLKAKLPSLTYQAKKLICPMGMEIEKIDACPKDCMLYRDNDKDLHACRICGKSRMQNCYDGMLKSVKEMEGYAYVLANLSVEGFYNKAMSINPYFNNTEKTLDDNELALVDPLKRKKRGPAKLKDKPTEPFKVEFYKNGRVIEQDQKDALWEIIKKKRAIGKVYAKQQMNYAHLGRSGYRRMDVDLSKVELDEALKAEILTIACDHTRKWILARITSPNISTNMEELFRKLVDVDKKMAQGLILKEKGADPLIVVLRPEHGGRTRTAGDDIGFRKGIEGNINLFIGCETAVLLNGGKLKNLDKRVLSNQELKSCFLLSPYTEDTTPIARGMVYSIGKGTIHGGPLIPYYIEVSIDSFVLAFGDTKLSVVLKADDTITLLEQSVWSFFQWPRCRISRTLENTPTSKDKASQSKAATLQTTLATPIPVNTKLSGDFHQHLTVQNSYGTLRESLCESVEAKSTRRSERPQK
nr:hypothetical protein [Tanacetum cinerariifolium]